MDFNLPELGEGVYEAELVEWRVKPGDAVKRGQELAEVVTDKASMPLPSPFFGKIAELRAEPGDMLKIGEVILTYESQARAADGEAGGETDKGKGAKTAKATKAASETRSASGGRQPPDVGEKPPSAIRGLTPPARQQPTPPARRTTAAPSVRRMARQLGIDLASVRGSGPGGRVLLDDLAALLQHGDERAAKAAPEPAADYGTAGTRRKLIGIRRQIAEHMVQSKRSIPHYSYVDECDISELVRLRAALKQSFSQAGVKLTYLPFFVKAAAAALRDVPIVNSSLDEAAGEIVLHERCDIGIAVATPQGLLVPVVREADRKDVAAIAREIEQLSQAAREGKARREDMLGGTFTVTSIGGIGGLISTPVINHPQAAILGIGRVVKRPVYDIAGDLRPAEVVYLSFSFDHRILDGAIGAVFGNAVVRHLQNPAELLVAGQLA
jgi:2-oxoisovalerate dehydrogenase E2 component (dihydrolipoyl transacylase)